ncbi:MAG: DUF1579 family protein [Terriglobales bacterium]
MKRISMPALLTAVLLAIALQSQAQMEMPKPAPELQKLDYFLGTWTLEGDLKPGPMGPGGKMTETEICKWMDGGYFLTLSSDFKSSMGNGTGIAYMGWNADDKVYTFDEFDSLGEAEHSKGTLDGDTWTWSGEDKMAGQMVKNHFIIKQLSPTSYTFKFEMSMDGTTYTTVMDGKATKQK